MVSSVSGRWYFSQSLSPCLSFLLQGSLDKAALSEATAAVRSTEAAVAAYEQLADSLIKTKDFGSRDEARARWHALAVEFRTILVSETLASVLRPSDILAKLTAHGPVASLGLMQVCVSVFIRCCERAFHRCLLSPQVLNQAVVALRAADIGQESNTLLPSSLRVAGALARCVSCLLSAQPDALASQRGPDERAAAMDASHSALSALSRSIAEEAHRRSEVQTEFEGACAAIRRCAEAVAGTHAAVAASPTSRWRTVSFALVAAQQTTERSFADIEAARLALMATPAGPEVGSVTAFDRSVKLAQQSLAECTSAVDAAMRGHAELQGVLLRWASDIENSASTLCGVLRSSLAIDALYSSGLSAAADGEKSRTSGDVLLGLVAPMPPPTGSDLVFVAPDETLAEQVQTANAALEAAISPPLVRVALREAVSAVLAARHELNSAASDPDRSVASLRDTAAKLQASSVAAAAAIGEARSQAQLFATEHGQRPGAMAATAAVIQTSSANLARHAGAANGFGVSSAEIVAEAIAAARRALDEAALTHSKPPQSAAAAVAQAVLATEAARRATAAVSVVSDAIAAEVARRRDVNGARETLKVRVSRFVFYVSFSL